jgi:hypothetical protein
LLKPPDFSKKTLIRQIFLLVYGRLGGKGQKAFYFTGEPLWEMIL